MASPYRVPPDSLLEQTLHSIRSSAFDYYPRLRRVKSLLEVEPPPPLSLQTAAQVAALEKKYFSYYFREKVGVPFATWVGCQRLLKAMDLIAREDRPLLEVARLSGFSEFRTFERTFKKFTGLSPRQFKHRIVADS